MRRPLALFVAVAAIASFGTGCGSTLSDAATITFSLKGVHHEVHVTRDELLSEVGKLVANKSFAAVLKQNKFTVSSDLSTDSAVSAIWLSSLIRQQAIDTMFTSRHAHVTSTIKAQAAKDVLQIFGPDAKVFPAFDAKFRKTLTERQERVDAVLASFIDTSEAAGEKFYKANVVCASGRDVAHILVPTSAAAQKILDQLKGGASFSQLAQTDSTDKTSGAQGGVLGCLIAGSFVPEFEKAAQAAPFGKPIGPVHSQFGFHVILVTHAKTPTYDAVRTQVIQALTSQGQAAAQTARDDLLKSFKVHLDPRFGTWESTTDSQGKKSYSVIPPKAPNPPSKREGAVTTTTTQVAPVPTSGNP